MNRNQQSHALITAYLDAFFDRYGFKPTINRYRTKWGMTDVMDSVGYDRARELIAYYFQCEADHTPENFFSTFDRLETIMLGSQQDAVRRAELREQTRKRVEEFEQRSSGNQRDLRE